jgi:ATP-binding cassette subfamily B protein
MTEGTTTDSTEPTTERQNAPDLETLASRVERPVYRLLTSYFRPYIPYLAASTGFLLLARICWLLPPAVLGAAIDATLTGDAPYRLPLVPSYYLPHTDMAQLQLSALLIGGSYAAASVCYLLGAWVRSIATYRVQHSIRTDAYETTQQLRYGFFDDTRTGELLSVLNNDVNTIESFFNGTLSLTTNAVFMVAVGAAYMLVIHPQLAVLAFVVPVFVGAVNYGYNRHIAPQYEELRGNVGDIASIIETNLGGIDVVKAYGREESEAARVAEESAAYRTTSWRVSKAKAAFGQVTNGLTNLGYAIVFAVGGFWVLIGPPPGFSGGLTAGTLVTFLVYVNQFGWPFQRLPEVIDGYQEMRAASRRVLALFDETNTVSGPEDGRCLEGVSGRITYEDVTFSYPGTDERTVNDISVNVPAGETVGIVGATGAGKSTLVKLLLRFYDPDSGAIRIDNTDIQNVERRDIRKHIGYVGQEPYLFDGTVRENIAYAQPDASERAVEASARAAGAHEFVSSLKDGYDTRVGERGVKLSGGQRQRLSIARAVFSDPEILVLDEATSHVDTETEARIQENLGTISADRTTVVVAHRLSTIRDADTIIVLDDGEIAERGGHEELLDKDGMYADLWRVQVGEVASLPESFTEKGEV